MGVRANKSRVRKEKSLKPPLIKFLRDEILEFVRKRDRVSTVAAKFIHRK